MQSPPSPTTRKWRELTPTNGVSHPNGDAIAVETLLPEVVTAHEHAVATPAVPTEPSEHTTPSRKPSWLATRPQLPKVTDVEVAMFALITIASLVLRFWHLGSAPNALQGDEATVGLEARRVLQDGWIGPYTNSAAGQPTLPFYLNAISVGLLGNTILATRIITALFSSFTPLVLGISVRRQHGPIAGLSAAFVLAFMTYSIHFGRIAFPVGGWPFWVALSTLLLAEALRSTEYKWWVATGFTVALGVYVYNSQPLVIAVLGMAIVIQLRLWPVLGIAAAVAAGLMLSGPAAYVALVAVAFCLTWMVVAGPYPWKLLLAGTLACAAGLIPITRYALTHDNRAGYGHFDQYSVVNSDPWLALATAEDKAWFFWHRYWSWWDGLLLHPQWDGVDGAGTVPLVGGIVATLAVIGIIVHIRQRSPIVLVGVLTLLIAPIGSLLTIHGMWRRPLVIILPIALFAGLGMAWAIKKGLGYRDHRRVAVLGLVGALALVMAVQGPARYFSNTLPDPRIKWLYASANTDPALYMATLPDDVYVYSLGNAPFNYEVTRYLAPDVRGEDRTAIWGKDSLEIDPSLGTPVFILAGDNRTRLAELQELHGKGRVVRGGDNMNDPTFIAYWPEIQ